MFWALGPILLALAALALSVSAPSSASAPGLRCEPYGLHSWYIKTLSDPGARRVNFTAKQTTVNALTSLPRPAGYDIGKRLVGIGTTTYRVTAALVSAQIMHDRDIHLEIRDPRAGGRTMITEFPDPRCWGATTSIKSVAMRGARAALIAACGPQTTTLLHLTGMATITGVGFLDRFHKRAPPGEARNAIELHPVLAFHTATCTRA